MPGVGVWNSKCSGFQVSTDIISGLGINMGCVDGEICFKKQRKKPLVQKSIGKAEEETSAKRHSSHNSTKFKYIKNKTIAKKFNKR